MLLGLSWCADETPQHAAAQVLVFSYSCKMLGFIEELVIRAGYHYCRLDGSTPQHERQVSLHALSRRQDRRRLA
jgi:SNF2 family DNA or RNA helicase